MFGFLKWIFGSAQDRTIARYRSIVEKINAFEPEYAGFDDAAIKATTQKFRERLKQGETTYDILPQAYALLKAVCRRLKGTNVHIFGYDQQWDMVPFDVQLIGAIAMHNGSIAEMMTGEGKTLTATLPLYLHSLTGKGAHLVTVNDYLAERDCQWMKPIFDTLGVSTGFITTNTPLFERQEIYRRDIVYATASEFGFDYLRDNSMATRAQDQVQRDYYFALIDEVDSILIDEARTPLIISGPVAKSRQMYDELKEPVSQLVRSQREIGNKLALTASKLLEDSNTSKQAFHKLWLISKGTPRHKQLKRLLEEPAVRDGIDEWDLYYSSDQNKEERIKALGELYIIVDERNNEYELTEKGILLWSQTSGRENHDDFVMLDLMAEYQLVDQNKEFSAEAKIEKKVSLREEDARRKERSHNLRQLLRAHLLMERDVDYLVQENKIIIVDEHTGRPQPGRRFSDGLHQAIEAKEGVFIQKESQTYATVTLQNYFRMYERVSGMSGTAITEANEFKDIYKIDCLQIPTHLPCKRIDQHDEIYMTEREKYAAIVKDIASAHEKGQPVLVGTESVEVSEKLSRILRQNKLPHTVLNAKNHANEAETIANAGQKGSITVSTNMAGRGTDIKLGSSVADTGGLYVIGTSRHNSRRIDRQLRGRCARQGDAGMSKFFISFEDQLMRLFVSAKIKQFLDKLRPPEGEPIIHPLLNKAIETAQKRVEQRNFTIRKHTLQYDDVMNLQRKEIYAFRNEILRTSTSQKLGAYVLHACITHALESEFGTLDEQGRYNIDGVLGWMSVHFPVLVKKTDLEKTGEEADLGTIVERASQIICGAFEAKMAFEQKKIATLQNMRGLQANSDIPQEALRTIMLREVDSLWQEHLLAMDYLRSEVHMHSVAQKDPLTEFKHQAFELFASLHARINEAIAQKLFRFEISTQDPEEMQRLLKRVRLESERLLIQDLQSPSEEATHT